MSLVLAAIVITVFAALFVPPYLNPPRVVYQPSVSVDSPFGFTLHLTFNSTDIKAGGSVLITGWVNSTSASVQNITAGDSWAFPRENLWTRICTPGWPIGLGVMRGHYTQDNYTLGTLIQLPQPLVFCPLQPGIPNYFLLEGHSSKALVTLGGSPAIWTLQTGLTFGGPSGQALQPGVYTAVLADEWGDVLTNIFLVS